MTDTPVSDVTSDQPADITDEAILARFHAAKNPPPCARTIGFRMRSVSQEKREVEIEFTARAEVLANPMGQVQGGYLCAMLDDAMSVACMIASKMTSVAPTLEMKTQFLRPAMPGTLRAVGRVTKWGKTIAFTEGELFDGEGRLLAKATGTAMPTPYASYKKGQA